MPDAFELKHVTLGKGSEPRLRGVSLAVPHGRTAIVGYSGAGKTSLLNVLAGFETPDFGEILLRPSRMDSGRLPVFWVPDNGGLWPHLTVEQHLRSVCKIPEISDEILTHMNLQHRRAAFPGQLSQGESSRLSLARALAARPEIVVADEPLTHVDPVRKPEYWRIVRSWLEREQISMVFSCHEPETVLRHSEQIVCLHHGQILFSGATTELYLNPPSSMLGEFVGPLNWFEADEETLYFGSSLPLQRQQSVRPEHLQIHAVGTSELVLEEVLFRGPWMESVIRHLPSGRHRVVLHQPPETRLEPGVHVTLRRLQESP